jgi:peptidoglycan/LPS O-acetylase OafA/YrhL
MQKQSESVPRPGGGHIPALDGVRGLAVLTVFLYHYGGGAQSANPFLHALGETDKLGWSGVTLFFVLSGFLITGILWKSIGKPHWWRNFFLRRCLRIFPLYYFVMLLLLIACIATHTLREFAPSLGVYFLYLQNFLGSDKTGTILSFHLGHFWSLAVEEHFYLVWPFLLAAMSSIRRAQYLCLLVFLFSLASRVWIFHSAYAALHYATPARVGELAIGAWLALVVRENPAWLSTLRRFAPAVFFVSLAVAVGTAIAARSPEAGSMPMYLFGIPAFSFASAALIFMALQKGRWTQWLSFPPLRHLGVISYGIYVYHVLLHDQYETIANWLAPHASRNLHLALVFVIAAGLTLLIAQCSYTFFESRLLKLKDRVAPSADHASQHSYSKT